MKHLVRAFIVVLAVTGAVATTQTSSASTSNATVVSAAVSKTSALPIPRCAPNDPNACGIDGK